MLRWRRSSGRTVSPWAIVALLLGAGVAAFGLRFVVGWVLDGVFYLVWFVDALPQALVWFGLLAILFVLTLRLRGAGRRRTRSVVDKSGSELLRSDLAAVVESIRRAESSAQARGELGRRLGQAAVALRVKREAIPARQAWDDLADGLWPPRPDLQAVLCPERGRGWLGPRRGYVHDLARAVDQLWTYAQGGDFDGS